MPFRDSIMLNIKQGLQLRGYVTLANNATSYVLLTVNEGEKTRRQKSLYSNALACSFRRLDRTLLGCYMSNWTLFSHVV